MDCADHAADVGKCCKVRILTGESFNTSSLSHALIDLILQRSVLIRRGYAGPWFESLLEDSASLKTTDVLVHEFDVGKDI